MRFRTICEHCGQCLDFDNKKQITEYLKNHKQGHTVCIYRLVPQIIKKVEIK